MENENEINKTVEQFCSTQFRKGKSIIENWNESYSDPLAPTQDWDF